MSSLDLLPDNDGRKIRRLNKLPIYLFLGLVTIFIVVVTWGLSTRGIFNREKDTVDRAPGTPASDFADQLKQGISDGVIEAPGPAQVEAAKETEPPNPFKPHPRLDKQEATKPRQPEIDWREQLKREQEEQYLREVHRQQMARLQANAAAYDSPIGVEIDRGNQSAPADVNRSAGQGTPTDRRAMSDLYAAALRSNGLESDPNNQAGKEAFLSQSGADRGYLENGVLKQQSPFELKRGSVIPATLVTGINSDLPGRITAQVSRNVYDSATGRFLLIPQGTKLFGRYDSEVSFGQSRVLVIWTDLIFPNGSTLQLGGMPGVEAQGKSGFRDKVDRKYLQTFGAAVLVALIGTGIDMAIPEENNASSVGDSAEDAARRSFADTFGRLADQSIRRNMDVQPTLKIRPGYNFNIIVEQDVVFPGAYRG